MTLGKKSPISIPLLELPAPPTTADDEPPLAAEGLLTVVADPDPPVLPSVVEELLPALPLMPLLMPKSASIWPPLSMLNCPAKEFKTCQTAHENSIFSLLVIYNVFWVSISDVSMASMTPKADVMLVNMLFVCDV